MKSVFLTWLFAAILIAVMGLYCGMRTTVPGPTSTEALLSNESEAAAIHAGLPPKDTLLLVISSELHNAESIEFESAKENIIVNLKGINCNSGKLFNKFNTTGRTLIEESKFISKDKKHLLIVTDLTQAVDKSSDCLKKLPQSLAKWKLENKDFNYSYLSNGTVDNEMFELIDRDLDKSLIYTLPITLIILIWAFGSIAAALIPLIIALVSLAASLGLAAIYSNFVSPISATSSQLVVLLVLAIGIDYSLFFISRMREEVSKGSSYEDAISKSKKSTGVAIFWSGFTVALSLFGLFLMQDTILTSMAVVSIAAVILTVISSLWALPALLSILKDKIEYGQIINKDRKPFSALLSKFLFLSTSRPILTLLITLFPLFVLSSLSFSMKLGTTVEAGIMPKSMQSREAFMVLDKNYPDFNGNDFSLIISGKAPFRVDEEEAVDNLIESIGNLDKVRGPLRVEISNDSLIGRYRFNIQGSANDIETKTLMKRIEALTHSGELTAKNISIGLGGTLPYVEADIKRYGLRTPLVFGAVLILCFLFLLLAFRSIVVPLKAIILNLISTAASFGVLALVFQNTESPWNYGVIESFVPPLLFSILFGLSMDYHVFILSRIREETLKGLSTQEAVRRGILLTSGTITSAAFIMVAVFSIIATLELPIMKELGVGLAAAVLIDATLIRSLLLPASMILLGDLNWYLPSWLNFLPKLKIDETL